MSKRTFPSSLLLLLSLLAVSSYGLEWYQSGHRSVIQGENFDEAVMEKGKFKFIKFFTHNCGYCRKLKLVQQQLMAETQYSFRFHEVDCTLHYDLCMSKAAITAFPYVAVYNTRGQLHAEIRGFYPLQTMRETLTAIQQWQDYELAQAPVPSPPASQPLPKHQQTTRSFEKEEKDQPQRIFSTQKPVQTLKVQSETSSAEGKKTGEKMVESSNDWSGSVKQGVRATVIVLAVVFFNNIILPMLRKQSLEQAQASCFSKPRTIEIPIKNRSLQGVKDDFSGHSQENQLLNQCI